MRSILYSQFHNSFLSFSNPETVLYTRHPGDVTLVLDEVEALVDAKGWHAVGFLTFESSPAFDPAVRIKASPHSILPLCFFALFAGTEQVHLHSLQAQPLPQLSWSASVDYTTFDRELETIKGKIAQRASRRLSYTYCLTADYSADPLSLFLQLVRSRQNRCGVFIDTPHFSICCGSSEKLFVLDDTHLTSRQMEIAAETGSDKQYKSPKIQILKSLTSAKTGHLTTVDMMREDLMRTSRPHPPSSGFSF